MKMRIRPFHVLPRLPEELSPLKDLAYNLWFGWHWRAVELFLRIDLDLWERTNGNPVLMLAMAGRQRLEELSNDEGFLAHMAQVYEEFQKYLAAGESEEARKAGDRNRTIAYFSAEYGIDECLPLYSGGLGILAGDHLKSASDMGIPLVGVGLMYRLGYFQQHLNADGWQQESTVENNWANLPMQQVKLEDGEPLRISIPLGRESISTVVWRVNVGRNQLLLLDANLPENSKEHRAVTDHLYGGDLDMRVRQEIVLGIGGMRALRALGIQPAVCHMNEGHSAFQALEQTRQMMEDSRLSFWEAREAAWASNVFTTHTPVPAGNDRFPPELMSRYFGDYVTKLGLSWKEFMALGRERPEDQSEPFCMTVLALKMAAYCNGVSRLHGQVSRRMWSNVWPGLPQDEVPITHVTNGIHVRSWISHDMADVFERYLGPRFMEDPGEGEVWGRVDQIPDAELWRTHERRRERLVAFARNRLREQMERRSAPPSEVAQVDEVLDPTVLTIAFARRFATYKRANLLLRDPDRLAKMLSDAERPVQLLFAGKAHPHDNPGKEIIQQIVRFARNEEFRNRIVFLEDYSIRLARYLVQGADVWLNTPRRPLEASGTSGMKAVANGVLHLSVLDGWWCEGYMGDNGWAIGAGEEYTDYDLQDRVEGQALFDMLEREIIPLFYERGRDGVPRGWIAMMKRAIQTNASAFNTHKMVSEYLRRSYIPAMENWHRLSSDNLAACKDIAAWRSLVRREWKSVAVLDVQAVNLEDSMYVGNELEVNVKVRLGSLPAEHVRVQLYYGPLNSKGEITDPATADTELVGSDEQGTSTYRGIVPCSKAGRHGFTARILPHNDMLPHALEPRLITWG